MSVKGQPRKAKLYSITSSASASTDAGTSIPSDLAVFDDKLVLRRLLNRKLGGFGAFQNSINILSPKSKDGSNIWRVSNQSPVGQSRGVATSMADPPVPQARTPGLVGWTRSDQPILQARFHDVTWVPRSAVFVRRPLQSK
jgi:hypothetical protein